MDRMASVQIAPSGGMIRIRANGIRPVRGLLRIMGFGHISDDLAHYLIHNTFIWL